MKLNVDANKWWRSTVASDKKNVGYHDEEECRLCSDKRDQEGDSAMPLNNIVVETYLGYYPVISKPREDVR